MTFSHQKDFPDTPTNEWRDIQPTGW